MYRGQYTFECIAMYLIKNSKSIVFILLLSPCILLFCYRIKRVNNYRNNFLSKLLSVGDNVWYDKGTVYKLIKNLKKYCERNLINPRYVHYNK